MRSSASSILLKFWKNEAGQTAIFTALAMTSVLGLGGVGVEAGHGYYAYRLLVASTDAAALAGAQVMPNTTAAGLNVTAYSSQSGQQNATSLLTNVVATPSYICDSTVSGTLNVPCLTSTGGSGGSNAVQVTQTADVSSWFAGLFGIKTFHLSYTSTAAMRGGTATPWNIAIILDATNSMSNSDGGTQCSGSKISCALQGVQYLLEDLYPCQLGQTCTSGTATFVDDVSLYAFPPMTTNSMPYDYCASEVNGTRYSSGDAPTHGYYVLPTLASGYTYQVTPYSHDYQTTDGGTLNTSSNIVKATGYTGTSCSGIQAPGGAGTYYAQVIYQAQSDLVTQQTNNPGSKNAMIILTDGDATSTVSYSSTNSIALTSTSQIQASSTNSVNGLSHGTASNNASSPTYPSAVGLCGQAVWAAQAATKAGTTVYTIGYGSPTSSSCTLDKTYSAAVTTTTYGGGTWAKGDQSCAALQAMASNVGTFYSDDGAGCKAASTNNASILKLTAIMRAVVNTFTSPRLVPNP